MQLTVKSPITCAHSFKNLWQMKLLVFFLYLKLFLQGSVGLESNNVFYIENILLFENLQSLLQFKYNCVSIHAS